MDSQTDRRFAVTVTGTCSTWAPEDPQPGDTVIFDPSIPPRPGEIVAILQAGTISIAKWPASRSSNVVLGTEVERRHPMRSLKA